MNCSIVGNKDTSPASVSSQPFEVSRHNNPAHKVYYTHYVHTSVIIQNTHTVMYIHTVPVFLNSECT